MIKVTPATHSLDTDIVKSQNHHPQSSNGEKTDKSDWESVMIDAFRWSRCKKPLPQKMMRTVGIPLPPEHVEVLSTHPTEIFTCK